MSPPPSRREFLKISLSSAAAISLATTCPAFISRLAFAQPTTAPSTVANDNILVVVQLSGGNDGLNTVIPHTDDAYHKARPRIGIKDRFLPLDDHLALNPGMKGFKELFDQGQLAIVNGCGYPKPNRSHFRSMEIWHTADPTDYRPQGWLGHYLDHALKGTAPAPADNALRGINIGSELPLALVDVGAPIPSIQSLDDFRVRTDPNDGVDEKTEQQLIADLNAVRDQSPALQFLSRQATNAILTAEELRKLKNYKQDADYPRGLGQELRLIAQLISGHFGTRVYYCQTGGFDTHANQVGGHENVLRNVADSIAAFHKDLAAKGLNDKVTVMCFSEFGRRLQQNGSNGTDHGAAAPMFVSGGKVKGGLHQPYPSLTDLDSGDLKFTTDFRRVYATLLKHWLNADPAPILQGTYEPLAFL
jgi:uncharacterized protein (DUF1501 family)